jgi:hypothetical protein
VRFKLHRDGSAAELAALFLSVAAFAAGPPNAEDPELLLQQIKAHLSEHLAQLPNYTCRETINRTLRAPSSWQHLDTVKLEVAFVGQEELFSRPGAHRFGEQSIEKIGSGGTIGNGAMGSLIDVIFSRNVAEFKYVGLCKKDGRKTFRYDLRVPIEKSQFRVRHAGEEGTAGYAGSVWVDARTLDLVRVDFRVNRIPSHIGVRLIEESTHYRTRQIGKSEFDLPDHSELGATDDMGNYSLNMVKLDRCREFVGESVVKYAQPPQGTASRERQDQR